MSKLLAVLVLIALTFTPLADAQTYPFKLTPLQQELTAQPGDTVRSSISLQNITNKSTVLQVSAIDFEPDETSGSVRFKSEGNAEFGISKWFSDANVQRSLTIPANQTVNYEAVFRIPFGTSEQSYFGSVRFTDSSSLVALESLVFITVGSPKSVLTIQNIRFSESTIAEERFGVFTAELTNTSKSLSHPELILKVTDKDGNSVAEIVATEDGAVLPESKRTYTFAPESQLPSEQLTVTVTAVDEQGVTADGSIQIDRSAPASDNNQEISQILQEKHAPWLTAFAVTGIILLTITLHHLYRHNKMVTRKAS